MNNRLTFIFIFIFILLVGCTPTEKMKIRTADNMESTFVWQKNYEKNKNFTEASLYCKELTSEGYADWRLPNLHELCSLADNVEKSYMLKSFKNKIGSEFWTASIPSSYTDGAWYVRLKDGKYFRFLKSAKINVKCVRGKMLKQYVLPQNDYCCK